ncbi:MAG: hypothetical protein QOF42_2254, partial [Gammaproteobacteria bacterium]|nr:hypothetical protein [Gammaproteobacteria bacterium]
MVLAADKSRVRIDLRDFSWPVRWRFSGDAITNNNAE